MTGETEILQRYSDGGLGWRQACLALGLWNCDELYTLLEKHRIAPPAPKRENAHEPLAERILATVGKDT